MARTHFNDLLAALNFCLEPVSEGWWNDSIIDPDQVPLANADKAIGMCQWIKRARQGIEMLNFDPGRWIKIAGYGLDNRDIVPLFGQE